MSTNTRKILLIVMASVLSGGLGMALLQGGCTMYQDLKFLHAVRVMTEQQRAKPAPPKPTIAPPTAKPETPDAK